ncbi:MAG: PmoA family protein [Pirellulaceae bacterium]|nr:PmoA family protein [Pirellulaceae bacterium]
MNEYKAPRCQILPLAGHQVSFRIDGAECTRWHFGTEYPRPFFYPLTGPRGDSLTRVGHPGAGNHDHHRSVWFAHAKVLGINFWSDLTEARIEQHEWLVYDESDTSATMAVRLHWKDGHEPRPLLEQVLVAVVGGRGGQTAPPAPRRAQMERGNKRNC